MKLLKPKKRDIKIFAVDDDPYYIKLIEINLNKLGFNDIRLYSKGEECILDLNKYKPDIILLDYVMKEGMDGDEILKIIKKDHHDTEVIILSGLDDIDKARNVIDIGATDYVVKNKMSFFNIGNSLNKLSQIINHKELDDWKIKRNQTLVILICLSVIVNITLGILKINLI